LVTFGRQPNQDSHELQPMTFLGLLMNNVRSVSMVISVRFRFIGLGM